VNAFIETPKRFQKVSSIESQQKERLLGNEATAGVSLFKPRWKPLTDHFCGLDGGHIAIQFADNEKKNGTLGRRIGRESFFAWGGGNFAKTALSE